MLFGWYEDGGEVSGAVFRTPPFELLLAAVPEEATAELVAALLAAGADIPGVNGDVRDVDRFASAWTAATGEFGTTTIALDLYELGTLQPPGAAARGPRPRGGGRGPRRRGAVLHGLPGGDADARRPRSCRWCASGWTTGGCGCGRTKPASRSRVAARTPAVAGVARIAPVYTPPEHRRHGYASAVTAACTADALARDAERVVLYTDLADPSANAMYQRIGFRPIGGRRVVQFATL